MFYVLGSFAVIVLIVEIIVGYVQNLFGVVAE